MYLQAGLCWMETVYVKNTQTLHLAVEVRLQTDIQFMCSWSTYCDLLCLYVSSFFGAIAVFCVSETRLNGQMCFVRRWVA